MKKSLLILVIMTTGLAVTAQSPTIVAASGSCIVIRNFNTSDEGFSSPSIYSSADDVSFDWNAGLGAEVEASGLTVRSASLISPVYLQGATGNAVIGFRFEAPAGGEYRVRIISATTSGPLEILATTSNGPVYSSLPGTSGSICLSLTDADLTAGRLIRFEFTFRLNQPGNVLFDDMAMSAQQFPLPVTFEGFVARKNTDGSVKLLWNVGEEVNVKGYYVEASSDGIKFTDAGYTTASGKSIYSANYTGLLAKTMFFRVRNVDFDGRSKYTPIIRVYSIDQTNNAIQIYPMPATDMVTVEHKMSTGASVITLISMDGRVMQQVNVVPFTYQTQLNISQLVKGVYIVNFKDEKANAQSLKLIKN